MKRKSDLACWLLFVTLIVTACRESDDQTGRVTPTPPAIALLVTVDAAAGADLPPLPTLLPTATGLLPPTPLPTRQPAAPGPTATPIDFQQVVVSLTYAIPALGLERSLEGTISSQIRLRDEQTGATLTKQNQAAVLLDVQQVLERLELAPYPEDCLGCVLLSFELPLSDLQREGWLQNETILASLENYFAANLGPHFPPGTLLGLRRSATPFEAAHTLVISEEGELWFWSAVAPEVSTEAAATGGSLLESAGAIDVDGLATSYRADCPASAIETLFLGVNAPILIAIRCPELALPTTLTELYGELEAAARPLLSGEPRPPELDRLLPLAAYLYYERPDATLTLYPDGQAAVAPRVPLEGQATVPTTTLSLTGALTATTAISLTQHLRAAGLLRGPLTQEITARALVTQTESLAPFVLILRDEVAVWAGTWVQPPGSLASHTRMLDRLIDAILRAWLAGAEPTPDPEATAPIVSTSTPTGTSSAITPTVTVTPSQ